MPCVLVVTRNLPPLLGGMERLNWHMVDELSRDAEVYVVGPDEAAERAPRKASYHPARLRPTWRFLFEAALSAARVARQYRPKVVVAGSGLTAPIALLAARLCGARAITYIHGLDITTRNPVYRALWLPTIRHMDAVIANSRSTLEFAVEAGVQPDRLTLIFPGAQTPIADFPVEKLQALRDKLQLGTRRILISVGRLTARKGLLEFVGEALPKVVARHPDTLLLIVGDAPKDALHAHAHAQTPESIRAVAQDAGIADSVRFIGPITDFEELCVAYQVADAHVFPVRSIPGDSEGFGMVAIEAAVNGTPTVAFATGGIVDAVANGSSGYLVQPHDYERLADSIVRVLDAPGELRKTCKQHGERFSWERFGQEVHRVLFPNGSPQGTPSVKRTL